MKIKVWGDRYFISRSCKATKKNHYSNTEYFQGYDFMGTATWGELKLDHGMDKDEAEAIMADLIAAE